MAGGRPNKSLKIHALSGAMEKNPQRFRDREVQPDCELPLGPAPEEWVKGSEHSMESRALVAAWEEISANLALYGLGNAGDRLAVKLACTLKVRAERTGAKLSDYNGYRSMLSELGLTERGRAGMQRRAPGGSSEDGEFGEYTGGRARRSA
jgi:hypothetical protein